jgi:hypothetical protein
MTTPHLEERSLDQEGHGELGVPENGRPLDGRIRLRAVSLVQVVVRDFPGEMKILTSLGEWMYGDEVLMGSSAIYAAAASC